MEDEEEAPSDGLEGIWRDIAIGRNCDGGWMKEGEMGGDGIDGGDRILKARESKLKRNFVEVEDGWEMDKAGG